MAARGKARGTRAAATRAGGKAEGKAAARPKPPGKRAALTPQMQRFAEELCANGFRAADAYDAAGYQAEGAARRSQVYKLLRTARVRAHIDAHLATLADDARTRTGAILERLGEVATFDPGEVFDFTGDRIVLRQAHAIPAAARRCIKKVKCTTQRLGEGGPILEEKVELEFHDRVRADELLGKYRRVFGGRGEELRPVPKTKRALSGHLLAQLLTQSGESWKASIDTLRALFPEKWDPRLMVQLLALEAEEDDPDERPKGGVRVRRERPAAAS